MIRKGQVRNIDGGDIRAQATFIARLFRRPPELRSSGSDHSLSRSLQQSRKFYEDRDARISILAGAVPHRPDT